MIGSESRSHQRFPAALLLALAAGCSGGGNRAPNLPPTIVTAAFVGGSATPTAGDTLLLFFSEDIALAGGSLFDDTDVELSANATLGAVPSAPSQIGPRAVAIELGAGVALAPGTTTIAFGTGNDAVADLGGALGQDGPPVTIGTSDGSAPVLTNVTIAAIDDALNGTGPAGGTLQVPRNGWTIDLTFADNGPIDHTRTQITATVAVETSAGSQPAGTNLLPFLTAVSTSNVAASHLVPATTSFPNAPFTLSCTVVDVSGLASNAVAFAATARAFTPALQPFETTAHAQQVWFLDFTRDVESFTATAGGGGASVTAIGGSNGRGDFEDLLHVLGLAVATPIPNVEGGLDSNAVVFARLRTRMLAELAALYAGTKVAFTTTEPAGDFGGNSSLPYAQVDHSRISVAGSSTTAGVLGIAIYDASNATQNDDTRTDFLGERLGVFLHTLVDSGLRSPSASAFRLTFDPLAPVVGGTAVGADAGDGARLLDPTADARAADIDAAITGLARFTAVVLAHECGHSMGLVQNGAMPLGLHGNDPTNFPGSSDGHIRTAALFPSGAANVMSPALSYSSAIHAQTAFNSLNRAYLREQVFYGN